MIVSDENLNLQSGLDILPVGMLVGGLFLRHSPFNVKSISLYSMHLW